MEAVHSHLLANEGRVMPEGTAGLVILAIAVAALIAMIVYGRVSRKRGRRG
ncbi:MULTISPECIES: hypothetical protein [Streptomyces]|uniref:Major facilitator superfamily (MFS) profile domain-containing protein n=1 Tax=Streptomyces lichenis TaxID=2306967 RepID=A0ABT0IJ83_9ACTN|nr:hypothetical protein [Streptomyces lichenis]MCK8681400.1 hypothetical protein [Streptomyces lichenis]